jgi:hypothetical protein
MLKRGLEMDWKWVGDGPGKGLERGWKRDWKLRLIADTNPEWDDLFERLNQ